VFDILRQHALLLQVLDRLGMEASLSVVIEDGGWSLTVSRALRKTRYAARLFRQSDSMKSMS
jgi:hypothetical protein